MSQHPSSSSSKPTHHARTPSMEFLDEDVLDVTPLCVIPGDAPNPSSIAGSNQDISPAKRQIVKKSPGKVAAVHLDNISFHLEDGAAKWKFVIQRRVAVERELGNKVVEVKEVMDLIKNLHARALASQQPSQTKPEPEVTFPPPEQQNPTTFEQPQIPPPTQQPNPPPEQLIHSPSEPQPNPQPEQTTPSPSVIPIPPTSVATITPILNIDDTNPPSPSSLASASEPETAFPTLEEAINVFAESSVEKIKYLTINSDNSDDPSVVRIHWNIVISWMTFEAFKLKGLTEQVCNDFIRDAGMRLQARLAREDEEQAWKEAEEKAPLEEEQRIREAEEKAATEAAVEAEAKAKADAEEAARIAAEEVAKAMADILSQGEKSNSGGIAKGTTSGTS
ncbi:uncharacterized protein LOC127095031 [Lathyrus oleraceus]|uniref:uncharacterized protein LOC127095031 n=1 Tax=Pisum sativum TaxID=3888 RepID=UPI0021D28E97|nr:uncharacterized protein LOC127095031 [Pisum sativum]